MKNEENGECPLMVFDMPGQLGALPHQVGTVCSFHIGGGWADGQWTVAMFPSRLQRVSGQG